MWARRTFSGRSTFKLSRAKNPVEQDILPGVRRIRRHTTKRSLAEFARPPARPAGTRAISVAPFSEIRSCGHVLAGEDVDGHVAAAPGVTRLQLAGQGEPRGRRTIQPLDGNRTVSAVMLKGCPNRGPPSHLRHANEFRRREEICIQRPRPTRAGVHENPCWRTAAICDDNVECRTCL